MMLVHDNLRIIHVTTHIALREVCDRIKKDRVYEVIKIAYDTCRALGIANPRIGVPGLNPHAGEGGLMGKEEEFEIIPAIEMAKKDGINVEGPIPPD